MAIKYNSIVQSVYAIQFTFDALKDIYTFINFADCTFNIKERILTGIITKKDGTKLSVHKEDYVVKDSNGDISVWSATEFKKKFTEVKTSE